MQAIKCGFNASFCLFLLGPRMAMGAFFKRKRMGWEHIETIHTIHVREVEGGAAQLCGSRFYYYFTGTLLSNRICRFYIFLRTNLSFKSIYNMYLRPHFISCIGLIDSILTN